MQKEMSKKPISREQVNKHLKSFAKEKADHVVKKSNTKIAKYYYINEVTVSKKIKDISKNMQDLTVLDVLEETNSSFKENVNDNTFDLSAKKNALNHTKPLIENSNNKSHLKIISKSKTSPSKDSSIKYPSEDLTDIVDLLKSLTAEMKFYETATGKTGIFFSFQIYIFLTKLFVYFLESGTFDSEELNSILDNENSEYSIKDIMYYLVQLVSQSMTHLLQNEIELKSYRNNFEALNDKVDRLCAAINHNGFGVHRSSSVPKDFVYNTSFGSSRMNRHDMATMFTDLEEEEEPILTDQTSNIKGESPLSFDISESFSPVKKNYFESSYDLNDSVSGFSPDASYIIQQNLMTGTSPSDWLFSSAYSPVKAPLYDATDGSY